MSHTPQRVWDKEMVSRSVLLRKRGIFTQECATLAGLEFRELPGLIRLALLKAWDDDARSFSLSVDMAELLRQQKHWNAMAMEGRERVCEVYEGGKRFDQDESLENAPSKLYRDLPDKMLVWLDERWDLGKKAFSRLEQISTTRQVY